MIHPESSKLILIETDHNAYTDQTKRQRRIQMAEEMQEAAGEDEQVHKQNKVILLFNFSL